MVAITPLLVLLVVAALIVLIAKQLRVPYTVALLLLGLGIGLAGSVVGFTPLESAVRELLSPGLFFDLILPPIIFEAALHVKFPLLRRRAGLILSLAFLGVIFTTLFTGTLVAYVTALPIAAAFLLAAILSPTDPIAIVDLFRRLRVPEELSTIVESEALLNDAAGVILFVVLLQLIRTGTTDPLFAAGQFAFLTLGGVAMGLAVAGLVYLLHRELHDPAVETALSVVTAYGAFLLAQAIGASGIIACAIAGVAVGSYVAPRAMDPEVRHSLFDFWSVIVYVANSLIFLAMGIVIAHSQVLAYLGLIAAVVVVMTVGRAAFVFLHRPLSVRGRTRLPPSWYHIIAISGIRGAIPVVLALSLLTTSTGLGSSSVDAIVASVLGVAFVSIVAGNLVADWYVKRAFPGPAGGTPGVPR